MSAEWQFLVTLNERLRPLRDPVEIQEVAVRLIGEHLQASRVNYAQIEGNEFVIRRSYARGVPPFAGRGPVARFGTDHRRRVPARRDGRRQRRSTPTHGSRTLSVRSSSRARSRRSSSVPLIKEGRVARDVRRPQRDAAHLDTRSDRAGRGDRRAHMGSRRARARGGGAEPDR